MDELKNQNSPFSVNSVTEVRRLPFRGRKFGVFLVGGCDGRCLLPLCARASSQVVKAMPQCTYAHWVHAPVSKKESFP